MLLCTDRPEDRDISNLVPITLRRLSLYVVNNISPNKTFLASPYCRFVISIVYTWVPSPICAAFCAVPGRVRTDAPRPGIDCNAMKIDTHASPGSNSHHGTKAMSRGIGYCCIMACGCAAAYPPADEANLSRNILHRELLSIPTLGMAVSALPRPI